MNSELKRSYFRSEQSIDRNIFPVHEVLGTARWVLKPAAKDNKTYGAIIPKNDQKIILTVSKKIVKTLYLKKKPRHIRLWDCMIYLLLHIKQQNKKGLVSIFQRTHEVENYVNFAVIIARADTRSRVQTNEL